MFKKVEYKRILSCLLTNATILRIEILFSIC